MFTSNSEIKREKLYPTIWVALDKSSQVENIALATKINEQVSDNTYGFKINIDSVMDFSEHALAPLEYLKKISQLKQPIFLDIKMHNGPTPMMRIVELIKDMVDIVDIHASAGEEQIKCVSDVLKNARAQLFAVTILTHNKIDDLETTRNEMLRLANMAIKGGAHGLIMPPTMLVEMRSHFPNIPIITPGIRPEWFLNKSTNYQEQIDTPDAAINNGSTMLVIGSPIHMSNNPADALMRILSDLKANTNKYCSRFV